MKTLIIFDLDNTLVHSIFMYGRLTIHIRPHFEKLFFYLIENNYDIGFWSLGEETYVNDIVSHLKTKINFNCLFIVSRKSYYEFIDKISQTKFNIDYENGTMIKKISTLKKQMNIETNNIILVDDLKSNILCNPKNNVYHIKEWFNTMVYDQELIAFENMLIILRNYTNF